MVYSKSVRRTLTLSIALLTLLVLVGCSPSEVPSKELVERQGLVYEFNSQTPFSGVLKEYHSNNQLWYKIVYKEGKVVGLYEEFDEEGLLMHKGTYEDGKREGLFETYDLDGSVEYLQCLKNDAEVDISHCS